MKGQSHTPIPSVRIASFILLLILLLPTLALRIVSGQGDANLQTDKSSYAVGGAVVFSGSGYSPYSTQYRINISYASLVQVGSLSFVSTTSEEIPSGVSWKIPFDAENGSYVAQAFNTTDPSNPDTFGKLVATAHFQVSANFTDKLNVTVCELKSLIDLVNSNVTTMGINNSLLASLNNSIRKLKFAESLFMEDKNKTSENQLRAARNMLMAFVHKVLAQSGKHISNAVAQALIGNVTTAIEHIDSMINSNQLPLGKELALNVQRTLDKQERDLTTFIIKKELKGANTDDDYIALANSMEEEMMGILSHMSDKKQLEERFWDNGTIDDVTFMMEMQRSNCTSNRVRAAAELLLNELADSNNTKPGLGKHLGNLIHVAKGLVTNCSDTGKSIGELVSKANSHSSNDTKHGDDNGNGNNNGNDNGKGNDKGGKDNGKGKGNYNGAGNKGKRQGNSQGN